MHRKDNRGKKPARREAKTCGASFVNVREERRVLERIRAKWHADNDKKGKPKIRITPTELAKLRAEAFSMLLNQR